MISNVEREREGERTRKGKEGLALRRQMLAARNNVRFLVASLAASDQSRTRV